MVPSPGRSISQWDDVVLSHAVRLEGPLAEDSPQRELSGMGHGRDKEDYLFLELIKMVVEHILLVTTYIVT